MASRREKRRQNKERRKEAERWQEKCRAMSFPGAPTGVVKLGQGAGEAVWRIVLLHGGDKSGAEPGSRTALPGAREGSAVRAFHQA
jgi:hypothetical protein